MFPDLSNPAMESALALVHQRFSTNTFPSWPLAHPYRLVAHNGEINTLRGNVNWMQAREGLLQSSVFGDDLRKVLPVIRPGGSDTASFDNVLEFLVMAGRSLPHAVLMMIPEPWSGNPGMDPAVRAFYEYHSSLMEPWDGPASIAFTDGTLIGAVLDRNGLRPSRYCITSDDLVIMASEVGVLDIPADRIVRKDRLRPGKMLLIDTGQGRIISDDEIKRGLAAERPYGEWLRTAPGGHRGSAERLRRAARSSDRAAPAAGVRLHAGGSAPPVDADGAGRGGADRIDGHRHRARRAVRSAASALRLLHAALCPGHQPAARRDSRRARHVDGIDHRPRAQPARLRARGVPADQDRVPDPPQRSGGEAASSADRVAVSLDDAAAALQPGRGRPRARARDGGAVPEGEPGGGRRLRHPDPLGPRRRRDARADSEPARDRRRASPPGSRRHAHPVRAARRDRRRARSAPRRAAARLRRRRGQSVSGVRDASRPDPPGPACLASPTIRRCFAT